MWYRLYYSVAVLCCQFLLPSLLLLTTHLTIYHKLANLPLRNRKESHF